MHALTPHCRRFVSRTADLQGPFGSQNNPVGFPNPAAGRLQSQNPTKNISRKEESLEPGKKNVPIAIVIA